jgi:DNA-binding beta-propeller fold protein YncE
MKLLTAILLINATAAFGAESLVLKATVPLPGVSGRFDHFAVDTNSHRIFVAALGNDTLEIIDVAAAKRLHTITGLHKPTGVAFLPEQNHIVVANGSDGTVKVFGGADYKLTKNITGLDDADNVRFDAKANRIYVGYGDGALAAIDAGNWQQVSTIKLKAHPESFQLEQNGSRIFVNVPDAKHIAVIDRETRAVIATWPMEKFRANFPMALDESNQRLFVGCRSPARLVVLDTVSGRIVTDLAISGDTDDLFYDSARKRLYLSCGEGFIDIISQQGSDKYELKEKIATRSGARTGFFSSPLNQFYLAVPHRGNQSAELQILDAHD